MHSQYLSPYKIFICAALISSFAFGTFCALIQYHHIDFSQLDQLATGKPSILLDDEGKEWDRFQLDLREPIAFTEIPNHVVSAFLAAEDWQFFSHYGISFKGIIRSALTNLFHGRIVQGASTITQQLVKLLFTNSERNFSRKIKEIFYASLVEMQYSKEQILQTYLNHVYFGCGIYGIQAASQRFWRKPASALTISEAACLAGIVQHPAQYCPLLCPLSAQQRRNVILKKMHKLNFIDEQAYQEALATDLSLSPPQKNCCAPHLKETIRQFLENKVGKTALYSQGFIIQTTINQAMQQEAERVFKQHQLQLIKELKLPVDGGLISMEVQSGAIKAIVGGANFNESFFNRALQARRQIGSVFKPLIYTQAIQQGIHFYDTVVDEPLELEQKNNKVWKPHNYNRKFDGEVTIAYALSHSSNIIPIKLLLQIGILPVIELAKKCHVRGPFYPYPSLALGCVDTTLLEVVGMFNLFANSGRYVEPHYLLWVKDQWGSKKWKRVVNKEQVIAPLLNDRVAKVLELGLKRIRRWYGNSWISCDAISKTGTTNDSRTCWFAGSTPSFTTALYIGTDDNQSMGKNVYPVRTAFPIWLGFNRAIKQPKQQFTYHPALKEVIIHQKTGEFLTDAHNPDAITIFS